jgi:hypothetical protein
MKDDDQSDLNEQKMKADIRLKQVKTKLHRYQLAVKRRETTFGNGLGSWDSSTG